MSKVYLVGAGPGDPGLLTLKGRSVLESAGAVLYDHLASPSLLDFAPPGAERLYVGKKRSSHPYTQAEIVELMIERARRGLTVVRLKGGDPFIFGRGGEELEALVEAGIPYEVVPGVTAPLGIAAYTGVPLTHRDFTSVVTFVTGHEVDSATWAEACAHGTVVVFMGLQHAHEIAAKVIAAGRSENTPAMAVRWGTRTDQRVITGTLRTLPAKIAEAGLLPPVTLVIGEVVSLRDRLAWFEKLPLFGQRVITTRARSQSAELSTDLRRLGAEPIEIPVIELAPLADYTELDTAIGQLETYDWLIFTSVNAVEYFLTRLSTCGRDTRAIRGKICAIGPATRERLAAAHLQADLMPEESISESVATAFARTDLNGVRVLLPRAASAREIIPDALTKLGGSIDIADAYRNIIPVDAADRIAAWRAHTGGNAEWILFTSGSTIKNWLTLAGRESLDNIRIASIGPATTEVLRKHGLEPTVEADPHTTEGLLNAIRARTEPRN